MNEHDDLVGMDQEEIANDQNNWMDSFDLDEKCPQVIAMENDKIDDDDISADDLIHSSLNRFRREFVNSGGDLDLQLLANAVKEHKPIRSRKLKLTLLKNVTRYTVKEPYTLSIFIYGQWKNGLARECVRADKEALKQYKIDHRDDYVMSLIGGFDPRSPNRGKIISNLYIKQEDLVLVYLYRALIITSGQDAIKYPCLYNNQLMYKDFPSYDPGNPMESLLNAVDSTTSKLVLDIDIDGMCKRANNGTNNPVTSKTAMDWLSNLVCEKVLHILRNVFFMFSHDGTQMSVATGLMISTFSKPRIKKLGCYTEAFGEEHLNRTELLEELLSKNSLKVKMGLHYVFTHVYLTSSQYKMLCCILIRELKDAWDAEDNPWNPYFDTNMKPRMEDILDCQIYKSDRVTLKDPWNVKMLSKTGKDKKRASNRHYIEVDSQHLPFNCLRYSMPFNDHEETVITDCTTDVLGNIQDDYCGPFDAFKQYDDLGFKLHKRWAFLLLASVSFRFSTKTNPMHLCNEEAVKKELKMIERHRNLDVKWDPPSIHASETNSFIVCRLDHKREREKSSEEFLVLFKCFESELKQPIDIKTRLEVIGREYMHYTQQTSEELNDIVRAIGSSTNNGGKESKNWKEIKNDSEESVTFWAWEDTNNILGVHNAIRSLLREDLLRYTFTYQKRIQKEVEFIHWIAKAVVMDMPECTYEFFCALRSPEKRKQLEQCLDSKLRLKKNTLGVAMDIMMCASFDQDDPSNEEAFKVKFASFCDKRINNCWMSLPDLKRMGILEVRRDVDLHFCYHYLHCRMSEKVGMVDYFVRKAFVLSESLASELNTEIEDIVKRSALQINHKTEEVRYLIKGLVCRKKLHKFNIQANDVDKWHHANTNKTVTYVTWHKHCGSFKKARTYRKIKHMRIAVGKKVSLHQCCQGKSCELVPDTVDCDMWRIDSKVFGCDLPDVDFNNLCHWNDDEEDLCCDHSDNRSVVTAVSSRAKTPMSDETDKEGDSKTKINFNDISVCNHDFRNFRLLPTINPQLFGIELVENQWCSRDLFGFNNNKDEVEHFKNVSVNGMRLNKGSRLNPFEHDRFMILMSEYEDDALLRRVALSNHFTRLYSS